MTIYEKALEFIKTGDVVGLGSGRASTAFIKLLGEKVKAGFKVQGVPTSEDSASLARSLNIPLVTLEEAIGNISCAIDGADEVDMVLNYKLLKELYAKELDIMKRFTHKIALKPDALTAFLFNVSPNTEATLVAYMYKTLHGSHLIKNPIFEKLLIENGLNLDIKNFNKFDAEIANDLFEKSKILSFGALSTLFFNAIILSCKRNCKILYTCLPVSFSKSIKPSTFQGFNTKGFSQITSAPFFNPKRICESCK